MQEQQEKTIATLHHELILKIFSDKCLGLRENMIISLVCNLWNNLSSRNDIWEALFSRNFSWSPNFFYIQSSIKESYRQQLSLNIRIEEHCNPNHQCSTESGLIEAIRENNLPLIEALLHSGHGICINNSTQTPNQFFDKCLQVLAGSTNLPPRLLIKIFENGIVDENMERCTINLFHILCLKGDQNLLGIIFALLGENLLKTHLFYDYDGVNLFSHLLNYPFYEDHPVPYAKVQVGEEKNRLGLILEMFDNVLGKTRMRSLLTFSDSYHHSFIHVLANHITHQDGNHHFFRAFSYLEKEDYSILLKEGSTYFDIPLFNLIHCSKSFKQLVQILGDDAPRFLKHENCHGYNFLFFLLFTRKFSCIPLLEEVIGQDFTNLLVKENRNKNMLKSFLGSRVTGVKDRIIEVLRLMHKYNLVDIIQKLHDRSDFLHILNNNCCIDAIAANEISDIFNEYLEEKTWGCTLL